MVHSKKALGKHWAVSTGNMLAARAAQKILLKGGSAVDAAITADAVMGVVEPMATSIGGDVLAIITLAGEDPVAYNGTGRSPALLTSKLVSELPNQRIPERHPYSITTPGAVKGWHDLHQRYGKLDWEDLFIDAIHYAQEGFVVAEVAAREWKLFDFVLHTDPHCAQLYKAGHAPQAGTIFKNPELARTLRRIAHEGWQAFYQGEIPQRTEAAMIQVNGLLRADDFERHQGYFCKPLCLTHADYAFYQCPPNTHGCAILDALANTSWRSSSCATSDTLALIDATQAALRNAAKTVHDSGGNTVCTVIVDNDGNAITLMSSIFKRFGSGYVVPGAGFVLQNRGFGFAEVGHINEAGPNKRPYHTVVPGAVTKSGLFHLGLGVVGGLMQPQGQIQIMHQLFREGTPLDEALAHPRWRIEGDHLVALEPTMDSSLQLKIRQAGYKEPPKGVGDLAGRSDFGGAQAIQRLANNELWAVSDHRKDGAALAN